jgi:hypothetical protein
LSPGYAERHPDADLAALSLDDPLIRLNAASAAARSTSADRAFQKRWSLSMSS